MKNTFILRLKEIYMGWSFDKKVISIIISLCLSLMLLLVAFGKITFVDGILIFFLPVLCITYILLFMIRLINGSFFERDYKGRMSPVYRRLLRNREKIGRDK